MNSIAWEVFPNDADIKAGSCSKSGETTTCAATFEPGVGSEYAVFASGYSILGEAGRQFKEMKMSSSSIKEYGNHRYKRIDDSMTWHDAQNYCASQGAHLATISSAGENQFVYRMAPRAWLGGTDEGIEGSWRWVTGEFWNFFNWANEEPNNCSNDLPDTCTPENYLTFHFAQTGGVWNDIPDAENIFVCEWDSLE